jgi:hypothetical protein
MHPHGDHGCANFLVASSHHDYDYDYDPVTSAAGRSAVVQPTAHGLQIAIVIQVISYYYSKFRLEIWWI